MTHTWTPGQRAVINRREIVTVISVTRGGRAKVGDRVFEFDGRERGHSGLSMCAPVLELLTPEIQAEVEFTKRSAAAYNNLVRFARAAERWATKNMRDDYGKLDASPEVVARAERLAAAIREVLGE